MLLLAVFIARPVKFFCPFPNYGTGLLYDSFIFSIVRLREPSFNYLLSYYYLSVNYLTT